MSPSKINISLIFVTRNRESILWESIGKAVEAKKNQAAEIIVVNDGDIELSVPSEFSTEIISLNNRSRGVAAARNLGAKVASGSIFFFIDDDMWINHEIIDWINVNLAGRETEDKVYNVNWVYPPKLEKILSTEKIGKFILSTRYNTMWGRMCEEGNPPKRGLYPFNNIASCSLLMPRSTFSKIGGYNEAISFQGEDIDLAVKINRLGIPILCLFDVTLHHNHQDRIDIDGYFKRIERGYHSQFIAEKKNLIPASPHDYDSSTVKKIVYNTFLATEKLWIQILRISPNNKLLEPFTNRLIGLLAGIKKYKQWKLAYHT